MKYSPAPWKQIENDDGDIIVQMDDAHDVYVANLEGSCEICHGNARLIELAPELLQSLKDVLKIIDDHGTPAIRAHSKIILKAREAIGRCEGKS